MTLKTSIAILITSITFGSLLSGPVSQEEADSVAQFEWGSKEVENYLGYENCLKCHQQQVEKLTTTLHFKTFETLHRSELARSFCRAMGIRSIKREARCIRCHYTPEISPRGMRAQSGISCESCHGPSKNWIQGHNDYGGLMITKAQETIAHRQNRIRSSIEKGMRHPSNLYLLAKSCYECHLIDDAELVNATDHPPISATFNMVSWSQGTMRHNFLRAENKSNAESSPKRLQVMFVVDLMARLEATLTSAADSTIDSEHAKVMQQEYSKAAKKLLTVSRRVNNQLINDVIEVLRQTPPTASPEKQISAAKTIEKIAFQFGKNESAHELHAIQDMLPARDEYR